MAHWRDEGFAWPVVTDNRNFRKDIPAIDQFFAQARLEADTLPKDGVVVRDPALVEWAACPVCGRPEPVQRFVKYGFVYADCPDCGHFYVWNRLREEVLLGLYSTSQTDRLDRQVKTSPQHLDYWGQVYEKYAAWLDGQGIAERNLLDLGCGAGTFLRHCAAHTAWRLHGLDFCQDTFEDILALTGRENYYFRQRIEDVDFAGKTFGVITLWGVLEHLVSPKSVLARCAEVLHPTGRMLLLAPNPGSRAMQILGVNTPTLNPRAHINLCTERSFPRLCADCGLAVVERFQELPVIDLMHPYVDWSERLVREIVAARQCYYDVWAVKKA